MKGNDANLGAIAGTSRNLFFDRQSRDKHLYVCGATGTGKSKFLENLIRQDITGWFKSRSGLLLLDPHGSLYDSVVGWLSSVGATKLPVILIDLRQDDWVVSYNALRRRQTASSSVIINNFVQSMAYVWGVSGTDQTPLLAKWAANTLRALYDNDLTLLEAQYLIDPADKEARHTLLERIGDRVCRNDWEYANGLSPRDFANELGSTANRLKRFLGNQHIRSMFGQGKASLDLRKALDEGYIILVSLACAGAKVSEEDADLFGTLLLSDLWTAALERGKKPGVKPFYLYLDEFQRFVTPTIARNLDEARGFGLCLTMANQYPQQLLDQGAEGQKLYHSVMENASSKVCFRLHSEENLRPMADWLFRGAIDPEEIKHTLYSTKVMAYREEMRRSRTVGKSLTEMVTHTEGTTELESFAESAGSSATETALYRLEDGQREYWPIAETEAAGSSGVSSSAKAYGRQESSASSQGQTASISETESSILIPEFGQEISAVQFRSLEEQIHRAMAALFEQGQRECTVRLVGMNVPVTVETPFVKERKVPPERLRKYVAKLLEKWDFALPADMAAAELEIREKKTEALLHPSAHVAAPASYRRRVGT